MTEYYFNKMGLINYNNYVVRDITERVALLHHERVNRNLYAPVEIDDTTRADVVAYKVYNDSFMDWMLWLNNDIVDPYYGWHLNEEEFTNYIVDKYGSQPYAQTAIAYYRLVWPNDDYQVPVGYYNNNLPGVLKKYYSPVWGAGSKILYYTRNLENWTVATNQIIQFSVNMAHANTQFQANDVLEIVSGGFVVGQVSSILANTTSVTVQHIFGNTSSPLTLQSFTNSQLTATTTNTNVLTTAIDLDEAVYWEGVSYYDLEAEENAKKRYINVLDPSTAMSVSAQMTIEMKE